MELKYFFKKIIFTMFIIGNIFLMIPKDSLAMFQEPDKKVQKTDIDDRLKKGFARIDKMLARLEEDNKA